MNGLTLLLTLVYFLLPGLLIYLVLRLNNMFFLDFTDKSDKHQSISELILNTVLFSIMAVYGEAIIILLLNREFGLPFLKRLVWGTWFFLNLALFSIIYSRNRDKVVEVYNKLLKKEVMVQYIKDIDIILILSFVIPFTVIFLMLSTTNMHGDGVFHSIIVKWIVEHKRFPTETPNYLMEAHRDGERMYYPITYPLTFYSLLAIFFQFGGLQFVYYSNAITGGLISLFVWYSLIKIKVNKIQSLFISYFIIYLNIIRFMISPLFEPQLLLIFTIILSVYTSKETNDAQKLSFYIIYGILNGLFASLKQQGMAISVILIMFLIVQVTYQQYKQNYVQQKRDEEIISQVKKESRKVLIGFKEALILICSYIGSLLYPIIELIKRNGTVDFVPGKSHIPFMESKYPSNPESIQYFVNNISYWPSYKNIFEVWTIYVLTPRYLYRATSFKMYSYYIIYLILFSLLFGIGIINLNKRKSSISLFILIVFIYELVLTFITNTPIYQYHNIGIMLVGLIIGNSINIKIKIDINREDDMSNKKRHNDFIKGSIKRNWVNILLNFLIILLIFHSSIQSYDPLVTDLIGNSGRYPDEYLEAYTLLANFISENVSETAIILSPYYFYHYLVEVDTFWINAGGGADIPKILTTNNETKALQALYSYGITHIFIDMRQRRHKGLSDYFSPTGLLDYIDHSGNFTKVFSGNIIYNNKSYEVLKLYEIDYTWLLNIEV